MTSPADLAIDWALDRHAEEGPSGDVRHLERRAAFQHLVREHLVVLYGLARRLGPSPEEAEDLVQETLLKAWRALARFRREADPRTWLYRILINESRDRWRRRGRPVRQDGRTVRPVDPASRAVDRELLGRVFVAVDALPRRQRECLLLRVRAGLSHQDIAELLGIRPGVVKLHLVHARRALHRRFGEEVREWGLAKR